MNTAVKTISLEDSYRVEPQYSHDTEEYVILSADEIPELAGPEYLAAKELHDIKLSIGEITMIASLVKDYHGPNIEEYIDKDFSYFKDVCNNIVNTLTLELEHIDKFDKQYIRCYTSEVTSEKQAIIMMAGGLNNVHLSDEGIAEFEKIAISLYNQTDCHAAGLQPINPTIANAIVFHYPAIQNLFNTIVVEKGVKEHYVGIIAILLNYNKTIITQQRLLYERLVEIIDKVT